MALSRSASRFSALPISLFAPPASVYDAACHALAISTRHEVRRLLATPPVPVFHTARLAFPDAHAVALCVALLASHGANSTLVHRFLTTWTTAYSLPYPLPFPNDQTPTPKRPRSRWLSLDFSSNRSLSPRGASAILAACLLLPADTLVELSIHDCPKLSSLTLTPWLPLLSSARSCATLVGLRLDSCPLRMLPLDTLRQLPDIRWISLRYTGFSNLWRCAEVFAGLRKLTAALVSGTESRGHDQRQLDDMREFCRKAMHAIGFDAGNVASHALTSISTALDQRREASIEDIPFSYIAPPTNHPAKAALLVSQQESVLSGYGRRQRMARPQTAQAEASLSGEHDLLNASHMAAMREQGPSGARSLYAPVVRKPFFWDFMVVKARESLKLLDGIRITPQKRDEAKRTVMHNFEGFNEAGEVLANTPITGLLRLREEGLSKSSSLCRKVGVPSAAMRKRKRRRTTELSPKVVDIMATVHAAGFPTTSVPATVCPSTNANIHLGAAKATADRRILIPQSSTFTGTPESSGMDGSSSPDSDKSSSQSRVASWYHAAESDFRSRCKFLRAGCRGYSEGDFEASVSAALLKRPGAPRIQYLDQWQDRPRQFEYNPARPSELVYGTEDGYVVLIDQETGEVKGSCLSGGGRGSRRAGQVIPQSSDLNTLSSLYRPDASLCLGTRKAAVYGLSWLNNSSDMLLSGSNDGAIHVYNVHWMRSGERGGCVYACDTFSQITSLHVACDDVKFAVSGYQKHVGIFDLGTGRQTEMMRECHKQPINVIRFAHSNPNILVTASFDEHVKKWDLRESCVGGARRPLFQIRSGTDNVTACFSPDDSRLLVSAVDNDVRQYHADDGRLELEFNIPKSGANVNYTRSYYMNDRDYIITGSSMENVVRVYNAKTGSFFREIDMDDRETVGTTKRRLCVQTLRANPGRKFNFSALLAANPGTVQGVIACADLHRR